MKLWDSQRMMPLRANLRALGFRSMTDYLASRPGVPYAEMADGIGGFPRMKLKQMRLEEADAAGTMRAAAMDPLPRELVRYLPGGWGRGEKPAWKAVLAHPMWSTAISSVGD